MINPDPAPVAAFDYSNVTCAGQAVQFTDLSLTNGGGAILTWLWNFDDPGSGVFNTSTLQNPSHIFTTPNVTYNVTLTVTSVGGCSNTITRPVFIHDLPPVDFVYDTVCLNAEMHFDANSGVTQLGAIATWTWDFGDGSPIVHDPVTTQHL
ncbi:MAG: PKD domain-containing protein [Marinilabiliales bacterium]|nr:PKD domain-containing protein [Marinilabiliales bacterium]